MKVTSKDSISYLLGAINGSAGEVAWWNSADGGKEFIKEKVLINEDGGSFKLSNMIRNAHPDAKILATQKIEGTNYSRIYLLGTKGAIKRKKAEADVLNVN